ncbi:hypothetical protein OH77DRAFT_1140596 [Trametes cingulata]|nr:hypothetical protein OH77DRAFT_1140596 [Trametes cingulata]
MVVYCAMCPRQAHGRLNCIARAGRALGGSPRLWVPVHTRARPSPVGNPSSVVPAPVQHAETGTQASNGLPMPRLKNMQARSLVVLADAHLRFNNPSERVYPSTRPISCARSDHVNSGANHSPYNGSAETYRAQRSMSALSEASLWHTHRLMTVALTAPGSRHTPTQPTFCLRRSPHCWRYRAC